MVEPPVVPETILLHLAALRFGPQAAALDTRLLLDDLQAFCAGRDCPAGLRLTPTGLRSWFRDQRPTAPNRQLTLKFLYAYLLWMRSLPTAPWIGQEERLIRVAHHLRGRIRSATIPLARSTKSNIAATIIDALPFVEGIYQTIRPYALDGGHIILDVIHIRVDFATQLAFLTMYSYQNLVQKFHYLRGVDSDQRYHFRNINENYAHKARRNARGCPALFMDGASRGTDETKIGVITGCMMRGFRARSLPFVAFKSPFSADIDKLSLRRHHRTLDGVSGHPGLFVGEIGEVHGPIFDFCKMALGLARRPGGETSLTRIGETPNLRGHVESAPSLWGSWKTFFDSEPSHPCPSPSYERARR